MDILKLGFEWMLPGWPLLLPPVSYTTSAVPSSHQCLQVNPLRSKEKQEPLFSLSFQTPPDSCPVSSQEKGSISCSWLQPYTQVCVCHGQDAHRSCYSLPTHSSLILPVYPRQPPALITHTEIKLPLRYLPLYEIWFRVCSRLNGGTHNPG